MGAVHNYSKKEIKAFAVGKRKNNEYFDTSIAGLDDVFHGSIDRFCDIAYAFRNSRRVLDAGSGEGLFVALLKMLGHDIHAVDLFDYSRDDLYKRHNIPFKVCNIEMDSLPFDSDFFDAVSCCQAFEHITHSHLLPALELRRVLKPGGILEIDVPNAVCFRNRSRIIRGKHITYDYRKHYLNPKPFIYKDREFYPLRHNREFTKNELELLLREAGFNQVEVTFLKSRRYRTGLERLKSIGTAIKDVFPSFRKSLIAFAVK